MEIKVTFKFDCSDGFLNCIDKLREAAVAITRNGDFETLPEKGMGVVRGIVTEKGAVIRKKEQVYPPLGDDAPVAEDSTPDVPATPQGAAETPAEAPATEAPEEAPAAPEKKEENPVKAPEKKEEPATEKKEEPATVDIPVQPTLDFPEGPISVAQMRAETDALRRRIEGEDYATNKSSDGYKLYHKQLSYAIKGIVLSCKGSNTLDSVPQEWRPSFIQQVREIVLEDGKITTKLPF